MFTNFPSPVNYNLGGLVEFNYIHISSVAAWPNLINGRITSPLTLKAGFNWLKGYSTRDKLQYTEESKSTPQGSYYEKKLGGFLPGDSVAIQNLISLMQGKYFIVQFKEVGGLQRLAGGYGDLLEFSSNFNSGAARGDLKGYSFTFSGNGLLTAPTYL